MAAQGQGRDDLRLRLWRRTFDISVLEVGEGVIEVKATKATLTWAATTSDQRLV